MLSAHDSAVSVRGAPAPASGQAPASAAGGVPSSRIAGTHWDADEAVRAAANRELHADLLEQGIGRLGAIAGVAALVLGAYLGAVALLVPRAEPPWDRLWPKLGGLLLAAVALSVATYGVTRIRRLRPQLVHDVGYFYLVALSLLLGFARHAEASPLSEVARQVSPAVVPILVFGALIPASPRTSFLVLFGAALMDPLALYVTRSRALPSATEIALLVASPLLAALVGQRIAHAIYRLSEGAAKAREIGSYKLVRRLGVGGMAEVWLADHAMLARPAAVKLIRSEVLVEHGQVEAERLLRLFLREARTTASLSSPHTIQVYDFGITREGAFYYVMELLDGVDLKKLVERYGPQSSERTAYLLRQVCRSLGEAHERDFVHRDVKLANIFTCRVGGECDFAKVLDFGLVLDRHPTAEELEDERRFVGTPAIMAPEMVRYQAPVDARADLYAVGCVGYQLLTGKRVFEAQTRHDMLVMHAHQKPIPPSKRVEVPVDPRLEALIMNCLEKSPDRRPQTARELGEHLAGLEFEHAWTEERARLWWRRHAPTDAGPESLSPSSLLEGSTTGAGEPVPSVIERSHG